MTKTDFELKILRQNWILDDGVYDEHDICSHGEVCIKIASEELSNKASGSWSLSTAGLYLLRSLFQDCRRNEFSNQLVPCCGHSIYPGTSDENSVEIPGCGSGVDWKVTHHDDLVTLESEVGTKATMPLGDYKEVVLKFVGEIEDFFGDPEDKAVSGDELEQKGFKLFWAEWRALKIAAGETLDLNQT